MFDESGEKFFDLWQKLDDLTKKASKEIAKMPVSTEPREEPVSLEDVGLDAPNVRRRRGRSVKTFSQWIQNEPKEKWSLLFDKGGVRHGIMTSTMLFCVVPELNLLLVSLSSSCTAQ
jgi:hypothetical protein